MVPNYTLKCRSGQINHLCKVTSRKINENAMGNRGSKSKDRKSFVKEQRIDGSLPLIYFSGIRYILNIFERNFLTGVPSNHLNTSSPYEIEGELVPQSEGTSSLAPRELVSIPPG